MTPGKPQRDSVPDDNYILLHFKIPTKILAPHAYWTKTRSFQYKNSLRFLGSGFSFPDAHTRVHSPEELIRSNCCPALIHRVVCSNPYCFLVTKESRNMTEILILLCFCLGSRNPNRRSLCLIFCCSQPDYKALLGLRGSLFIFLAISVHTHSMCLTNVADQGDVRSL